MQSEFQSSSDYSLNIHRNILRIMSTGVIHIRGNGSSCHISSYAPAEVRVRLL
jgi:hypothetical protein